MLASRVRTAAIAAAIGSGCGVLFLMVDRVHRTGSLRDVVPDAWIMIFVGAFLGWWAWLFWRALKAKRSARFFAAAGLLILAPFIFAMETPNIDRARRFHQEGLPTDGIVTGVFPEDHNHIGYRYLVSGVPYGGSDFAPGDASEFQVGDTITVYFLRSAPAQSAARYPTETTRSVLLESLFGGLWLVSGGVISSFHVGQHPRQFLQRVMRRTGITVCM